MGRLSLAVFSEVPVATSPHTWTTAWPVAGVQ